MTESPTSFARFARPTLFPRGPRDLASTDHCPACFRRLDSAVCADCGLDLTGDDAAELARVSAAAAALLEDRVELIGRLRFASAARSAQQPPRQQPRQQTPATDATPPRPAAVSVAVPLVPPGPPAAPRAAPGPPAAPRRSSVQVALLVVGVSLVSIAATFFLVYAFINFGIVWRSVIIGAITVAAFVVASLLRRRGLGSTAEGIAAFSVVLVYLDAFAVRANDLFGAASADALGYWGATLTLSAIGFAAWHRASGLRTAAIAAVVVFAPGIGLLAAALAAPLEPVARALSFVLAVGLAGLVHPFAGGRAARHVVERVVALGFAVVALPTAFGLAFAVAPETPAAGPLALVAVAGVSAAHLAVVLHPGGVPAMGGRYATAAAAFFAVVCAAAATIAVALLGYRVLADDVAVAATPPVVLALALAISAAVPRATTDRARFAVRGASIAALVVASATLVPALAAAALTTALAPLTGLLIAPWRLAPFDPIERIALQNAPAVLAIALAVVVVAGYQATTRSLPRPRAVLSFCAGAVPVLAVPLLGVVATVVAGWLLLAAAAVAALVFAARRGPSWLRPPLAVVAGVSVLLAYSTSWASTQTWLAASIATAALLLIGRFAVPGDRGVARAGLLAAAALVAVVAAAALGRSASATVAGGSEPLDGLRAVSILAVALVLLAAIPAGRLLSTLDRRTLFFVGAPVAAVSIVLAAAVLVAQRDPRPALAEPATSLLLASALLAGLAAWLVPRANRGFAVERRVAAVAAAPVLYWALDALARLLALPPDVTQLAAISAAAIVAACGLAAASRGAAASREPGDLGAVVVATFGTIVPVVAASPLAWLALLIAAATVLLLAASPDGLIGARSSRRHLAWAALALAAAGFWWLLLESSVTAVEAYALPLAGVLLAVAALDRRSAGRRGIADATAPVIAFAGLLVSIVPVAVSAATDDGVRAAVVFAIAAVLLVGGSVVRAGAPARPYLDAAAAAGFAGTVVLGVGQGIRLLGASPTPALDAWAAAGFVVLTVAAIGQCAPRPGDRAHSPRIGDALFIAAMLLVLGLEGAAFDASGAGFARAVATVAAFSALHLLGFAVARGPFGATALLAVSFAAIAGVVALWRGSVDAVEWVSVPIAATLLVTGALRLARTPAVRSWPALGSGLGVLLVPSLLATLSDRPVWRLVAIGVVAVLVLLVGFARRLQAPFLIGGVVALVHGVATFAPQLREVYQLTEWWVWAGAGGIVIIVLGALYERSLRTARSIVVGIGGLR